MLMMWLMMVILRVVRLIETVLLFFTCVILVSPGWCLFPTDALTICVVSVGVKNYVHSFLEKLGTLFLSAKPWSFTLHLVTSLLRGDVF